MKADLIVDLQYGSTGKGLLAGYLSMGGEYDAVACANMPNAGHTCIDLAENKMIHKVLPSGVIGPGVRTVLIGPGAVYDPEQLNEELKTLEMFGYGLGNFDLMIHPNATILDSAYVHEEESLRDSIGSTAQGAMAAQIDKMWRNHHASPLAKGTPFAVTHDEYNKAIQQSSRILIEGSQGFSLSINGRFYPYCTSRAVDPARICSDVGVPFQFVDKVIGTCRTYPIRVGGNSGPYYGDQEEIQWEDLGIEPELTTTTGRQRRIFTWSQKQYEDACWACQPDEIFLNFCNYCEADGGEEIMGKIGSKLKYTGWGPAIGDIACLD